MSCFDVIDRSQTVELDPLMSQWPDEQAPALIDADMDHSDQNCPDLPLAGFIPAHIDTAGLALSHFSDGLIS